MSATNGNAPRPVFETLRPAVRCAIRHGTVRSEINVPRWAKSYATTDAKVRKVWAEELERYEREQLTKIPPATSSDDLGEGK